MRKITTRLLKLAQVEAKDLGVKLVKYGNNLKLNAEFIYRAARKAGSSFFAMLPVMLAVLLLTSLMAPFLPHFFESGFLAKHIPDAVMGAVVGGIAAGQPVVSYVLGGELSASGVSLAGVTALVVAWVTVGATHLPIEAAVLGWRFSLIRNLLSFLFAIIIAFEISGVMRVFS